jgi:hypothetical protein
MGKAEGYLVSGCLEQTEQDEAAQVRTRSMREAVYVC